MYVSPDVLGWDETQRLKKGLGQQTPQFILKTGIFLFSFVLEVYRKNGV